MIEYALSKRNGSDWSESEIDGFVDMLVEWAEKNKIDIGGGCHLFQDEKYKSKGN